MSVAEAREAIKDHDVSTVEKRARFMLALKILSTYSFSNQQQQ